MDLDPPAIEVYEVAVPYTGPERRRFDRRSLSDGAYAPSYEERRSEERRLIHATPREELLQIARRVVYKDDAL